MKVKKIKKRDGRIVDFESSRIYNAILKAVQEDSHGGAHSGFGGKTIGRGRQL